MLSMAKEQDYTSVPMTSEGTSSSDVTLHTSSTPSSGGVRKPLNIEVHKFECLEFLFTSDPGVTRVKFPDGRIEEYQTGPSSDDTSSSDSSSSSEAGSETSSAASMRRLLAMPAEEALAMPEEEFFAMLEDGDALSVASTKACSSTEAGLWTLTEDEE
eukprot:TRINITY_DN61199_c0_g1_i1.p1 TRINITY_DN61199_c0_g1~~TRINITY_DN61199_c0_g1_i1.p1  ORF type:complete len:180 (+),score=32.81 TRINITY_DN61199_c0_g1_i1:69-542(+)